MKILRDNSGVLNCVLFWVVWWTLTPSHTLLPRGQLSLCPVTPCCPHFLPGSHIVALLQCLCLSNPNLFNNDSKSKRGSAGNLVMPKGSDQVLPLNEKVNVLDKEKKIVMLRLLRSVIRTNLFVKLWGRKKILASCVVTPQNAEVTATVPGPMLGSDGKALRACGEDRNTRRVPVDGSGVRRRAPGHLQEGFGKGRSEMRATVPFTASKRLL